MTREQAQERALNTEDERKDSMKIRGKLILSAIGIMALIIVYIIVMAVLSDKNLTGENTPGPVATVTPGSTPVQTPANPEPPSPSDNPVPSDNPDATDNPTDPGNQDNYPGRPGNPGGLVIRTDYEVFKPNEVGEIPIVMFHNFIEAYEEKTEKEFTTTFAEFEQLLETLYNEGYRLISMADFIDCNISVPAGCKPMVFTFDDGTPGQFNLIEENGTLKVNPKSAVGVMVEFSKKHPDFGLRGIFYVNMDRGNETFKGQGTLRERFEILLSLGFELGTHTWGHVDFSDAKNNNAERIQEAIGKNQEKAEEILPGLRFYSMALPFGSQPVNKDLRPLLVRGIYNNTEYYNESILAVGANPSVPSISVKYKSDYVSRIRAQGRVPVDCDLTWWLPRMTSSRMFISDGDPSTIVVPEEKLDEVNQDRLGGKKLITY